MSDELEVFPLEIARTCFPPIWTIYDHPRDYPKRFIVRVFYGLTPEPQSTAHDSLADARVSVQARGGCVNLGRQPKDDPVIVESWI